MKFLCTFLLLLAIPVKYCLAYESDYTLYHKGIINAEREIFINKDSIMGLQYFKNTFAAFDFVYVDDCIEAFELALYFRKEDMALTFIKKAIDNGFETSLLDSLSMECSCNMYLNRRVKVTIHKAFVTKYRHDLEVYTAMYYPKYLARINKELLGTILKRHVREQAFKNYPVTNRDELKLKNEEYARISDDNLRYIDSLARQGIYIGERNLGIYTNRLADSMRFPFIAVENQAKNIKSYYHLPVDYRIPFLSQYDYFETNPVYIIYFHNTKAFDVLKQYKDDAIKKGFMHPREYASLQFKPRGITDTLYLYPSTHQITATQTINKCRAALLLPEYEIDFYKHKFAHEHNLRLNFGFL
ncbi:hypothetical protein CJD36_001770 [Flavipsychrobacter stenotrophus]|uniref:Uncharacterized protein n=1 Tax=Flavipsychrobacter stenotrophus TaxID=2077091 RepID=A0A2S7SZZ2_9BACT|nr:hypothetical protein [Flavipsychrobacter stenotrophus]PQJ12502.1 hypothetical protein CJD36_001770 [Flavipsychrobacter stenotrophus]